MRDDTTGKTEPFSLTRTAGVGMSWMITGTIVGKLASVLSQWALGWLLEVDEYAVFAIAFGISSLVGAIQGGSIERIMIQKGAYAELARPYLKFAFILRSISMILILTTIPLTVAYYQEWRVVMPMIIIAVSIIGMTPSTIMRAKLSIDLKFKTLSFVSTLSSIARQISAVIFALIGLGAASLALPLLVVSSFDWIAYRMLSGPIPRDGKSLPDVLPETLRAAKWLILTGVALVFVLQGDYVVVSILSDKTILGYYFFGYQLTATIWIIFGVGLRSIITPSMAKLTGEITRQGEAYIRALKLLALTSSITCVASALIAGPIVHMLWAGKWDGAIPVVQILSVAMIFRLLGTLGIALVEAQARWRLLAVLMISDAIGVLIAAGIGAFLGNVTTIGLAVGIHQLIIGMMICGIAGKYTKINVIRTFKTIAGSTWTAIIIGCVLWFAIKILLNVEDGVIQILIYICLYSAGIGLAGFIWMRGEMSEMLSFIRTLIR